MGLCVGGLDRSLVPGVFNEMNGACYSSHLTRYLLKCYHGGIDGFTANDHDLVKRRRGSRAFTGNASSSLVRRSRRRRRVGGAGGIVAGLGPSLGSGDVSSTDSDSESSLGSDPDEDGEAQTPWRREQRQGALRFHNVALRSVYVLCR